MHIPVFRPLCPSYASEYLKSHEVQGKEIKETDHVLIGCTADERKALEALLILREKKLHITLYSERPPTALFLCIVRKLDNVSLLFCPESMEDIAHCAEFYTKGKRFVSKAAQRKNETELLGRFINLESLICCVSCQEKKQERSFGNLPTLIFLDNEHVHPVRSMDSPKFFLSNVEHNTLFLKVAK